jgi:hypothetical protein
VQFHEIFFIFFNFSQGLSAQCGLLFCFDLSNRRSRRKTPIEKTNLKNQPHFEVQADIEK